MYQLCRCPGSVGGKRVRGADEASEALLARHDIAAMPFEAGPGAYLRFSALYRPEDLAALAERGPRLVQA
jgi:hypothetical protein